MVIKIDLSTLTFGVTVLDYDTPEAKIAIVLTPEDMRKKGKFEEGKLIEGGMDVSVENAIMLIAPNSNIANKFRQCADILDQKVKEMEQLANSRFN